MKTIHIMAHMFLSGLGVASLYVIARVYAVPKVLKKANICETKIELYNKHGKLAVIDYGLTRESVAHKYYNELFGRFYNNEVQVKFYKETNMMRETNSWLIKNMAKTCNVVEYDLLQHVNVHGKGIEFPQDRQLLPEEGQLNNKEKITDVALIRGDFR